MATPDFTGTITITAPTGVDGRGEVAVLNNTADTTNYVGNLADFSGFDSPTIRLSQDNVVEGHGATFGSFFYGPRSFTLDVQMALAATNTLSNARLDKLLRATNAMSANGTITWAESGLTKLINFRREAVRGPDNETRRILLSLISADPRILSNTETTTAMNASVVNLGNGNFPPTFTLTTPSNPVITNTTTGEAFSLTLTGGTPVTVDFANHTVDQGGVSRYSSVNFTTSTWWELVPGTNAITVSGVASSNMIWRSAWI